MDLKTQKKVAIGGGAAVGLLALGFAVHGCASSENKPSPHQATPVSAPVYSQPPTTAQHTGGDKAAEKRQKLSALELADIQLLHSRGFKVGRPVAAFGSQCSDATGLTNGDGYHGTSTAISYPAADASGKHGEICVAHSGKGGSRAVVSNFSAP